MREFTGKMPGPKIATRTLCASLRNRNAFSQGPLYVRIYRKNAGAQHRDPHKLRACAIEMHLDTFHESHFTREFTGKMPRPKTATHTFRASLRSRNALGHFITCHKRHVIREFTGKKPGLSWGTLIKHRPLHVAEEPLSVDTLLGEPWCWMLISSWARYCGKKVSKLFTTGHLCLALVCSVRTILSEHILFPWVGYLQILAILAVPQVLQVLQVLQILQAHQPTKTSKLVFNCRRTKHYSHVRLWTAFGQPTLKIPLPISWSHPFSSGPGIFLDATPDLSLQNGSPGNFLYWIRALDRLLHYKMSTEKGLKQGWNSVFSSRLFSKAGFTCF